MQLEQEAQQLRDDQLSFRYTMTHGNQSPTQQQLNNQNQNSLCEHHRKKLSDLFLVRHLTGAYDFRI